MALSTGTSRLAWLCPIIGPPNTISAASSVKPPQAAMTSDSLVPNGITQLPGLRMPRPETVMMRSISGSPVSKILAMLAVVATFCTSAPIALGSLPDGTSRPVTALISIFSAPCGYLTCSGWTVTSRSVGAVARITSIASGLLFSMPITARRMPSARSTMRMPMCTRSGCSSMTRWSEVR